MLKKRRLVRRIRRVIHRMVGRNMPVRKRKARPVKPALVEHGFSTPVEPLNTPHEYHPERNFGKHDEGWRKTNYQ